MPTGTTPPVSRQPVFTIPSERGPIDIVSVVWDRATVAITLKQGSRERQILSAEDHGDLTRSIYEGGRLLYSITRRDSDDPDQIHQRATDGVASIEVEFIPGQRLARYKEEDGRELVIDIVWSRANEPELKRALRMVRDFLPANHRLVNNPEMTLMEEVTGNQDFQAFLLSHVAEAPSRDLSPLGDALSPCPRKITAAAAVAMKYGCRYWALPNPWIASISATGCVVGTALFWGCLVAEMTQTPGEANAQPPAGGGSSGAD